MGDCDMAIKLETATYDPARSAGVRLLTGRCYTIRVKQAALRVELLVDPRTTAARDDRFIVRAEDGSFERQYTVADDAVPGDARVTLELAGLLRGVRYTLVHDRGADGAAVTVFAGRTLEQLLAPPQLPPSLREPKSPRAWLDPLANLEDQALDGGPRG